MLGSPEIADQLDRRFDITDLGVNNGRRQRAAGFARARMRLIRVLTKASDDKLTLASDRLGELVDYLDMCSDQRDIGTSRTHRLPPAPAAGARDAMVVFGR
jgi:hypothetical protein